MDHIAKMETVKYAGKLDYPTLPLTREPPPREMLIEASKILSYLKAEFIPSWKKSQVEIGTRFEGKQVQIIIGVPEAFICECQTLIGERFKESIVPVVVERETLPYVKKLDFELKPWWKFW